MAAWNLPKHLKGCAKLCHVWEISKRTHWANVRYWISRSTMEQSRRRFFQHKDKHYLLTVDYFSSDLEICLVSKDVNPSQTILQLITIFSRHGNPDNFTYLSTTAPSLIHVSSPTFPLTGSLSTLPHLQDNPSPKVKWKGRSKLWKWS